MEFRFERILIPVDFSITTEVAINKALKLVEGPGSLIHLLYVNKSWRLGLGLSWFNKNNNPQQKESVQKSFEYWENYIEHHSKEVRVSSSVADGSDIENLIASEALKIQANLIILGRQPKQGWLPLADSIIAGRLSTQTRQPVLTVMPAALNQETRTVVLPIEFSTSEKKLELMQTLARKFRMHIHLVTLVDEERGSTDELATSFLETFGWLKQHLHCQVEYNFLKGPNKAKALVQYCLQVNADLLLIYPARSEGSNWGDKHICDLFPSDSKTQILTV